MLAHGTWGAPAGTFTFGSPMVEVTRVAGQEQVTVGKVVRVAQRACGLARQEVLRGF